MNLKQYDRYGMNFKDKWVDNCASVMGVSLFLRVVYFFGLTDFAACSAMQIVVDLILTIGLSVAFLVMLVGLRYNAPGLYAMMGGGLLLFLMITTFSTGDALRIIFAIPAYGLAAVALVGTVAGYLPGKLLAVCTLVLPLTVRFLAYDLGQLSLFTWVLEISRLLIIVSMLCFVTALRPLKNRN